MRSEEWQKIAWRRGLEIKAHAIGGLGDYKLGCMEEEVFELHCFSQMAVEGKITVFFVAKYGVSSHGKVTAYLVHPAGSQFQLQ